MEIGVRALRDSLSKYLTEVKAGRTVTVTEHGKPIARIVPIGEMSVLERLIAEGQVQPPSKPKGKLPKPIKAKGTVSDLVIEQRR